MKFSNENLLNFLIVSFREMSKKIRLVSVLASYGGSPTPSHVSNRFSPSPHKSLFVHLEEDPTNRALALRALDSDVNSARASIRSILDEYYSSPTPTANHEIAAMTSDACIVRLEGLRKALIDVCIAVPMVAEVLKPVTQEYEIIIRRLITEVRRSPATLVMDEMKGAVKELLHVQSQNRTHTQHVEDLSLSLRVALGECEALRAENVVLSDTLKAWRAALGHEEDTGDTAAEIESLRGLVDEVSVLRDHITSFHKLMEQYKEGEGRKSSEIDDLRETLESLQKQMADQKQGFDAEKATKLKLAVKMVQVK